MKSLTIVPMLVFASLALSHCKSQRPLMSGSQQSQLSTVSIGNLVQNSNSEMTAWTSLRLQMKRTQPSTDTLTRTFQRPSNLAKISDANIKVRYGIYNILLSYTDRTGKSVFESCAEEKSKAHSIDAPKYAVIIQICSLSTGQPIGEVKLEESEVVITPVLSSPPKAKPPTPGSASFVSQHGSLTAARGFILDQNQQPVQLKGMSLFWSQWSNAYWNAGVINTLSKTWKSTVVRAAMGIEEGGYLSNPEVEKARVKTIVDQAIAQGIYVIIDWHDYNAQQHTRQAVEFFSEMAGLYANTPNVIFEIFNEPMELSWNEVKVYAETVIKAIRAKGAKNLVIVGSPSWSQRVDLAADNPVQAENVAYTLHFYAGTHRQELRDKAAYAISKGLSLFVTEFGVCDASGDTGIDLAETDRWMKFLDQHKIGWANWALNDKKESASALKPGANTQGQWTDNDLTESGVYVKKLLLQ